MTGEPFYLPVGDEVDVFAAAHRRGLPVLLKGPTGCGKTRFVEAMAHRLGRPLVTVACHEDLTAADLVGRFLLEGGDTVWVDGPLTRAAREGAICYLDEIVEARADTTVVIHPVADHRRELFIERRNERVPVAPGFQLVLSFNPGYQSVLKDLKASTRQRAVGLEMTFPPPEIETRVVQVEAGVDEATADRLVRVGQAIRRLDAHHLHEVASTRALVAAGQLIAEGLAPLDAARAALVVPLTDDEETAAGLEQLVSTYLDG
jgi:nitric oxide reductase NorQ protein